MTPVYENTETKKKRERDTGEEIIERTGFLLSSDISQIQPSSTPLNDCITFLQSC